MLMGLTSPPSVGKVILITCTPLEDQVATVRTKAVPAKRGQSECVGGVVDEIKAALERQFHLLGVAQSGLPRPNKTIKLRLTGRLPLELSRSR